MVIFSPNQIRILTVAEPHNAYATELNQLFLAKGFRSELDLRGEKIGFKIRDSILKKANYLLILGDKEVESRSVSVRKMGEENTTTYTLDLFLEMIEKERNS